MLIVAVIWTKRLRLILVMAWKTTTMQVGGLVTKSLVENYSLISARILFQKMSYKSYNLNNLIRSSSLSKSELRVLT